MKIYLYIFVALTLVVGFLIIKTHRARKIVPSKYINYKHLSDGVFESETYELVKIFEHYKGSRMVDGINYFEKIFYDSLNENTILAYSLTEYEKTEERWHENGPCYVFAKIDKDGNFIDSLKVGNYLADNSGVFFFEEDYINWINNGDKARIKFLDIVDGDALNPTELDKIIYTADDIVVDKDYDTELALIYLKSSAGWTLLRSEKLYEQVEYGLGWFHAFTLKPYVDTIKERFIEIPYYNSWADTNAAHTDFLVTEHFMKEKKHKSSLGDFNNTRRVGWSGTGYFKLNYKSESIYFKAHAFNQGLNDVSIYFTKQDFVVMQLRKRPIDDRDFKDSGTFILRKK